MDLKEKLLTLVKPFYEMNEPKYGLRYLEKVIENVEHISDKLDYTEEDRRLLLIAGYVHASHYWNGLNGVIAVCRFIKNHKEYMKDRYQITDRDIGILLSACKEVGVSHNSGFSSNISKSLNAAILGPTLTVREFLLGRQAIYKEAGHGSLESSRMSCKDLKSRSREISDVSNDVWQVVYGSNVLCVQETITAASLLSDDPSGKDFLTLVKYETIEES